MLLSMLDTIKLKDIGSSEILGPQAGERVDTSGWQEARTLATLNIMLGCVCHSQSACACSIFGR